MSYLSPDRELNPEHVRMFLDIVNKADFYQLIGMKITELKVGLCRAELEIGPHVLNSFGGIHGGVYAAICDTITYMAMYGDVSETQGYTTLDLTVNDLKSIRSGTIYATGRPIRCGRHILMAEADIRDAEGSLLCTAQSKMFMSHDVQPLEQLRAFQKIDKEFPPKFITKPTEKTLPERTPRLGA